MCRIVSVAWHCPIFSPKQGVLGLWPVCLASLLAEGQIPGLYECCSNKGMVSLCLFTVFGDDGFGDVVRDVGVVVEFHAGAGASLSVATQIGGVAEHFTERHERRDFFDAETQIFHR